MSPSVSVAICTKDRLEDLKRTLSVLISTHATNPLLKEIVVVDNSATGTAQEVVAAAREEGAPTLSYFHVSTPGVSSARTKALREVRGDVLVFVDDDMDVSPDLIESHSRALSEFGVGVSLGRIVPDLASVDQAWLAAAHNEMLGGPSGRLDLGPSQKLLPDGPAGFGGNTAIRVDCVPSDLTFPDALGWDPNGVRFGGEDTYFFGRLAALQGAVYTPKASVVHRVPASRLGPKYFRIHNVGQGRASIRLALINKKHSRPWLILVIFTQPMKWFRYLWPVKFGSTKKWVRIKKRQYAIGKILESFNLLFHPEFAAKLVQQSAETEYPPS